MENTEKSPLPEARDLYFYGTGLFDTDFIYTFETVVEENMFGQKIGQYLNTLAPDFRWHIHTSVVAGAVDNYSPPKIGVFLSADLTPLLPAKTHQIRVKDGLVIEVTLDDISVDIFRFNCGIFHFLVRVPQEYWRDEFVLSRVRFFVQKHQHPPSEFGTDLETIFNPMVTRIRELLTRAQEKFHPPLLETPFLDFTTIADELGTTLNWTHSTLVAILPPEFDLGGRHYQGTLLDLNPDGIRNCAIVPSVFAYVESGDSLVCLHDKEDIRARAPARVAKEDWVTWLALHSYTWKTVWQLDRGLHIILNLVVAHLKHKRTEKYRDVYSVNALINYLVLMLDQHQPRNLTTTYYSIYFLERISDAWRTGEIWESANKKMAILRDLIGQLDEIEEGRRGHRVELFLTLLGVFALGSLVLDFFGAMSFEIPDWFKAVFGLGIPLAFTIVAYRILRT